VLQADGIEDHLGLKCPNLIETYKTMGAEEIAEFGLVVVKNRYIMLQAQGFYKPGAHLTRSQNKDFHG